MSIHFRTVAACALGAAMTTACATKGFVRQQIATQQAALDQERVARTAADSNMSAEIASLRTDLTTLRTEFGARIDSVAAGTQFMFPVNFAFDDATVREQDHGALDKFAGVIQKHYAGSKITVEGFADPAGTIRYNNALSRRRAENVRSYLVSKGISDADLKTIGYGKARLVNPGASHDAPGAEQNRRVVFVIETRANAANTTASAAGMQ